MYRLSLIIIYVVLYFPILAQNPHGDKLSMDCALCHTPDNWYVDIDSIQFNHAVSTFKLEGTHTKIDCKSCHPTLVFDEAPTECISCHTDVHSMSVGNDCVRCHTPVDWLVENIPELHEENGFPLIGAHSSLSCIDCHFSETNLRFDRIGNECISCHMDDYESTQSPNHQSAGFSLNCIECHDPNGFGWYTENIDHSFFPLTESHDIQNCNECHLTNNYADASPECISCHQMDFELTSNPDHQNISISVDCINCHTTEPDWFPASFDIHNDYYQLNGAHAIIANDCIDCHNGNYNNTPETCVGCHSAEYDNTSEPNHITAEFPTDCIECHNEDSWIPSTFDHDGQYFPIYSGEHDGEWDACIECHTNPSNFSEYTCITCHENGEMDDEHNDVQGYIYENSACLACHPTGSAEEGFNHDETLFSLTGEHLMVNCIECHAEGYIGTPTDCNSCHNQAFVNTSNPNHTSIGISTDCIACHTTDPGWMPATFENHNDYYPLNGAHETISNDCVDCHDGNYTNTPNTCLGCHQSDFNNTLNPNHSAAQFPSDCILCHNENAWEPSTFDHNTTDFSLTGVHDVSDCLACHSEGYVGTSTTCNSCHNTDYMSTSNPNHNSIGISTDCINCHTTDPGWMPATFDNHNDYYELNGAHATIANDCALCHNGDYSSTPNTCVGCHQSDYNATSDPNHSTSQFPTDCISCHSESAWDPSTFDHDAMYFPIYSGTHNGEWNDCITCHTNSSNYAEYNCFECHTNPTTDNIHDHPGDPEFDDYVYDSYACVSCHY